MNLPKLITEVTELARMAGTFIREESTKIQTVDIEQKGLHDLVSYVDRGAEQMILKGLQDILPGSGYLAEETGRTDEREWCWIVDPLDGTTNFVHKIPLYSISIGLQRHKKLVGAVVYEVNLDECFYAWGHGEVFLNGKPIRVSECKTMNDSLIATGFPYYDFSRLKPYLALFEDLVKNTQGIRRLGSAAVDLAYVACGRFEAFYEYGLHPWDMAAGVFLVECAGGKVSGFAGEKEVVFGKDILASNGHLHDTLLEKTGKYFRD